MARQPVVDPIRKRLSGVDPDRHERSGRPVLDEVAIGGDPLDGVGPPRRAISTALTTRRGLARSTTSPASGSWRSSSATRSARASRSSSRRSPGSVGAVRSGRPASGSAGRSRRRARRPAGGGRAGRARRSRRLVIGDGELLLRLGQVDEVVADPTSCRRIRLGGADVHAPVDLHRVHRHDVGAGRLGEGEGQIGFAGGGWADHGHQGQGDRLPIRWWGAALVTSAVTYGAGRRTRLDVEREGLPWSGWWRRPGPCGTVPRPSPRDFDPPSLRLRAREMSVCSATRRSKRSWMTSRGSCPSMVAAGVPGRGENWNVKALSKPAARHHVEGGGEIGLGLPGEPDDDVGGDRQVGDGAMCHGQLVEEAGAGVAPMHRRQDPVAPRLAAAGGGARTPTGSPPWRRRPPRRSPLGVGWCSGSA